MHVRPTTTVAVRPNSQDTHRRDASRRRAVSQAALMGAGASLAGVVCNNLLGAPMRVVKNRAQLDTSTKPWWLQLQGATPADAFRGWVLTACCGVIGDWWGYGVHHALLQGTKGKKAKASPAASSLAGLVAGASEAMLTNPLRRAALLQNTVENSARNLSPAGALKIVMSDGPWRGAGVTVVRNAVASAAYFGVLSLLNGFAHDEKDKRRDFVVGATAAMASVLVANPIDCVRARVQGSVGSQITPWALALQMQQQEGWSVFMRGVAPSLLRVAPTMAVGFVIMRQMGRVLHEAAPEPTPSRA